MWSIGITAIEMAETQPRKYCFLLSTGNFNLNPALISN